MLSSVEHINLPSRFKRSGLFNEAARYKASDETGLIKPLFANNTSLEIPFSRPEDHFDFRASDACTHECLADTTDDEEEDIKPPSVVKKVRFLPLQKSAVHEYEQLEWSDAIGVVGYDEMYTEIENSDEINDDCIYADPRCVFIPLLARDRPLLLDDEPLTRRHCDSRNHYFPAGDA